MCQCLYGHGWLLATGSGSVGGVMSVCVVTLDYMCIYIYGRAMHLYIVFGG